MKHIVSLLVYYFTITNILIHNEYSVYLVKIQLFFIFYFIFCDIENNRLNEIEILLLISRVKNLRLSTYLEKHKCAWQRVSVVFNMLNKHLSVAFVR